MKAMSLLPEIEDGQLKEPTPPRKLYAPPRASNLLKEEERLAELNNYRRQKVSEDFSDSPNLQ